MARSAQPQSCQWSTANVYKLIDLLHHESQLLAVTTKLLSEHKAQRLQRKCTKNLQHRIFTLWDEFDAGSRSAKALLNACSHIYIG